ncbi:amidohydrolase family protein [Salinibacterium sp. dk2585]|uniref:amidohydrolase n=1 Tax=unclassified Salinibacterium TaxID=2632331 RepID=UPI0011C24688|nr:MULTISPECIES: amidohydrolase [unclassified Salinibacterium]QEE61021.1 amidohydrolase family protein [Salinibacterium sp. dk2585]TXK52963.1 amidohydrolase family protein [Salinibacterium sp. dk5596]
MSEHSRLLITDVRLPFGDAESLDLLIEGERIARIEPSIEAGPNDRVERANGRLALPGFVDAHCHLDKTLVGRPWHSHRAGNSVAERVRIDHELRRGLGMPSVHNTTALVEQIIRSGTTSVRTHTEIDTEVGLAGVEVVSAVAERFRGDITIQQVAFPQSGMLADAAVEGLLSEAIDRGVRVIGGLDPAGAERDPVGHLNRIFALAVAKDCEIDLHLHDPGELGAWELDLISERTRVEGLSGRVNVSHAIALGQVDAGRQARLAEAMAAAGVSMTTCVAHNDPPPPVELLFDSGVLLTAGNDSIRNTWSPFGTGDMLERAWILAVRCGLRTDEQLQLALTIASAHGSALVRGEGTSALEVGSIADLVLVDALNVGDALARRPARDLVVHRGRVSARATPEAA